MANASTAQIGIERFLLYGAENALPVKELERLTGMQQRQITKAIQDARRRFKMHEGGEYLYLQRCTQADILSQPQRKKRHSVSSLCSTGKQKHAQPVFALNVQRW